MFGRVFRYQGWLWRALNTLTDILALSVLWLLCSIPDAGRGDDGAL